MPIAHSTPPPEELLQYLAHYKVVVCTQCKYAIKPRAIARHLKEIHRIRRSDREPFLQHVSHFDLAEHELVMQYVPAEFPVPLLPVQDGLKCKSAECAYLCMTEKRMKHHWLSAHGRPGVAAAMDWQAAPLQTFFKGNLLRYFTATTTTTTTTIPPAPVTPEQMPQFLTQSDGEDWNEENMSDDPGDMSLSFSTSPSSTTSSRSMGESDSALLHHFTTYTWSTFAHDEETQRIWHTMVPQLAHQHEYLMHALLACAALHLAYLHPEKRADMVLTARTKQDLAIPLFLVATQSLESESCDAVLVFVRMLGITSYLMDESLIAAHENADKLPSWLFFLRSGCTMFGDFWAQLRTGPVGYLTQSWETIISLSKVPHQPMLEYFLSIASDDWPAEVREPYNESAICLAQNFACLQALNKNTQPSPLDMACYWPVRNPVTFLRLLETWHPGALILLAHYSVILHRTSAKAWYLRGGAESILVTILRRLDKQWHRHLEWPLQEVGVTSSTQCKPAGMPVLPSFLTFPLTANLNRR